ncbi:MAG TPA: potassium-transporting ATPase subunit C [Gemmataceae bacterium]|nr:potassium-transporting ATPase subunit C [Gemmataceae bacterium]
MQDQKTKTDMLAHLRANVWLLVLSIGICCVLYPAAVWVVAQVIFPHQAQGSLIDKDGKPTTDPSKAVGSTLIAQQINNAWFFQPRPSAASFNAAASGGSNLAASSPKLRGRVAQLLGTISRYSDAYKQAHKKSDGSDPSPQEDIVSWYKEQPPESRWFDWANNYSSMAQGWATGTASIQDYIQDWEDKHPDVAADWKNDHAEATQTPVFNDLLPYFFRAYEKAVAGKWPGSESITAWAKDHPAIVTRWKAANPGKDDPKEDDLAAFFADDSAKDPGDWPSAKAGEMFDAAQKAVVQPTALQDSDIQGTFFDMWLTEKAKAKQFDPLKDFVQVPADLVTTSGSGLDPDISLDNVNYQEDTVVQGNVDHIVQQYVDAEAKAGRTVSDEQQAKLKDSLAKPVREAVDRALDGLPSRPMFGLMGDKPLVNVLELNVRLQAEMAKVKAP